jgi:hypothetical protein
MNKIEGSPDNQTPNQTEERSMTMMINKGWADLQSWWQGQKELQKEQSIVGVS